MSWRLAARLAVAPVLLLVLAWLLEPARVVTVLARFQPAWLAPIVALSVVQFVVSAWRWRFTAARLGLSLSLRAALADYYLASLVNQCLPGGVLGDAARAWRHGRIAEQPLAAAQAVVVERAAGQLGMGLMALASLPLLPGLLARLGDYPIALVGTLTGVALASVLAWRHARLRPHAVLPRTLLARRVWPVQLASSLVVAATYVGTYYLAARALGVPRTLPEMLPLIPPILFAMVIPVSVAGWGVRESAAAGIWAMAGFPAAEGVAISLAYGAVNLVLASPGLGVMLVRAWARPRHSGDGRSRCKSRSNRTSSPS